LPTAVGQSTRRVCTDQDQDAVRSLRVLGSAAQNVCLRGRLKLLTSCRSAQMFGFGRFLSAGSGGGQPLAPPSEPTARAMTIKEVSSAAVACSPINALARLVSGIVSVGLKALELVRDT
jgi:hypothetical protein